jgi:hypothetical protein
MESVYCYCGEALSAHLRCPICGVLLGSGHVFRGHPEVYACERCVQEPAYDPTGGCDCAMPEGRCLDLPRESSLMNEAKRQEIIAAVYIVSRRVEAKQQAAVLARHWQITPRSARRRMAAIA